MAKRILAPLCGLLLCVSLVGLVLAVSAKATLLDAGNARQAIYSGDFVAERTDLIRETLYSMFASAGLDGDMITSAVDESDVTACLETSVEGVLATGVALPETDGMFKHVEAVVLMGLEAGGGTVTEDGLEDLDTIIRTSEGYFAELTMAPMAGVIYQLRRIIGGGKGIAAIALCAGLAVLALCGTVWAGRARRTASLYLGSGLLGGGLALLVAALVLQGRRAAFSEVMARYYAPFQSILLLCGAVLAVAGLVFMVARLVLGRK